MMDNKYGHLYTADDMIAFARIIASSDIGDSDKDWNGADWTEDDLAAVKTMLNDFEGRFPNDEPLFLLRGQDRRALGCVRNYRTMIDYGGGKRGSKELLVGLDGAVNQFETFRAEHPDRMKDPD
jgi:hypothetical protein